METASYYKTAHGFVDGRVDPATMQAMMTVLGLPKNAVAQICREGYVMGEGRIVRATHVAVHDGVDDGVDEGVDDGVEEGVDEGVDKIVLQK